jgi:hypothetical protein
VAKTFNDLTDDQKKNFHAQVTALGLSPQDVAGHVVADGKPGAHPGAARSPIRTRSLTVQNLAHFKQLGGIPDERYQVKGHSDAHIAYPPPIPESRLRLLKAAGVRDSLQRALTPEEHGKVGAAVHAFVNGDSSKVPDHLVELAEAQQFPIEAAAGGAQDLTISGPFTIQGPGPVALVFGTITIKPGGYIVCQCDAKISAQVITNES